MKLEMTRSTRGRGVARNAGKVVFVEGALAGELVEARLLESRSKFACARHGSEPSASGARRSVPFRVCGGCATSTSRRARRSRQAALLEDNLARSARSAPGDARADPRQEWGSGTAALSVRYVEGKGGALVGFRERKSTYCADMRSCEVLRGISSLIVPLEISSETFRSRSGSRSRSRSERTLVLLFGLLPFTAATGPAETFAEANACASGCSGGAGQRAFRSIPRRRSALLHAAELA